jgi:hypothetical protein
MSERVGLEYDEEARMVRRFKSTFDETWQFPSPPSSTAVLATWTFEEIESGDDAHLKDFLVKMRAWLAEA